LHGLPSVLRSFRFGPTPGKRRPIIRWRTTQRVYLYDVLACPCGGTRTILADLSDPDLVRHILHDLGLPAEPPHVARARDPTYDDDA
jgi:hypothetical protein